jgi:hypothetical protein
MTRLTPTRRVIVLKPRNERPPRSHDEQGAPWNLPFGVREPLALPLPETNARQSEWSP